MQFEGCRLSSYKCQAGVWTIGYGHTGYDVKENMTITYEEAVKYLDRDVKKFEDKVNKYSKYNWTQNEFDALVSFAYNIGNIDQLTKNGTRTKSQIAEHWNAYCNADGKVSTGLVRRREAEKTLFLTKESDDGGFVGKSEVIVNGKSHEISRILYENRNYVSIRELGELLGYVVSNKGDIPILTKE